MKLASLLLSVLVLASCTGASEPPACRGDVFQLNPSRMAPLATLTGVPSAPPLTPAAIAPVTVSTTGRSR